jgi:nicotinamidase-related amidase
MAEGLRLGPITERTVHLCVDMQRVFAPGAPWGSPWVPRILPIVATIADRHPERTVFTRFIPPRRPEDMPGMWQRYYGRWRDVTGERLPPELLELLPPLAGMVPPAHQFDKATYSAFSSPALAHWLAERGTDGLIVTGSETDVCILATVLGAIEYGFRVTIVTDAICSSSDPGHDMLLELYRKRFSEQIDTATAEEILAAWPA